MSIASNDCAKSKLEALLPVDSMGVVDHYPVETRSDVTLLSRIDTSTTQRGRPRTEKTARTIT